MRGKGSDWWVSPPKSGKLVKKNNPKNQSNNFYQIKQNKEIVDNDLSVVPPPSLFFVTDCMGITTQLRECERDRSQEFWRDL